jgi:hypothetical protein
LKRKEALSVLHELCPEQSGGGEHVIPIQGFQIFDPAHGTDPEGLELRLIISAYVKDCDFIKSVADKHGLAVRTEAHFLVVYTPKS